MPTKRKATVKYQPAKMMRSDFSELLDVMSVKLSDSEIFDRVGARGYQRHGSKVAIPGYAAITAIPKKAPIGQISDDKWYTADEILDLWKRFASDRELEKITQL